MGLDSYLYGIKYISDSDKKCSDIKALFPKIKAHPSKIEFELGYWRKANAIHNWFINHVQGGVDDCGYYDVSKDDLLRLRAECELALRDKDSAALPPLSGFFFGDTEKNEWYYDNIKETLKIIKIAINFVSKHGNVIYHSSW